MITENNDFTIVKDYFLEVREIGAQGARPYANSKVDKSYRKKSRYYIMKEERFSEFRIKKSSILNLLSEKATAIETYVDENDLSYKKDDDLRKIFMFYTSSL